MWGFFAIIKRNMKLIEALELEAKVAEVLKREALNLYITLRSEKEGDVYLIIRRCPQLKDIKV